MTDIGFPDLTGTVTIFEAIWTTIAAAGIILHTLLLREAVLNFRALQLPEIARRRDEMAKKILAKMHIRTETARLFKQAFFLLLGIYAMTIPSNPSAPRLGSLLFTVILTIINLILIYSAAADYRDRRRVLDLASVVAP